MSVAEAHVKVARIDQERADFYRDNFGTNISDPQLYDLMVNTSSLSLSAAAQVVAESYRQRFG
jgi:cytidylate kinase